MKNNLKLLINPFQKIAGYQALTFGVIGLVISTILSWLSGCHYQGLMNFGPAPNSALWCFAMEHLIVWLIPVALFYIAGLIFSHAKIRFIDVLGTVAFAQLPLIIMNLFYFFPVMQSMLLIFQDLQVEQNVSQIMALTEDPIFIKSTSLVLISLIFWVWALIWMYNALRVSCNFKGNKLVVIYIVSIIGGSIITNYLIALMY